MNFVPDFIIAPFAWLLRFLAETLDNYGLALIALALVIALIRIPFDLKSKRGTMKTSLLQPKVTEIREKHKNNPQKMNQEIQKLYREENVKPMGGCIWMIVPMLIILVLFQIIRQPLTHLMGLDQVQVDLLREALEGMNIYVGTGGLYQVEMAGHIRAHFDYLHGLVPQIFDINMSFLGLDIGQTPNWRIIFEGGGTVQQFGLLLLPVLSMISAFLSQRVMMATNYMQQQAQQAQMMKTMMLMMPLMSLIIGFTFPAAMSLYWTASSVLMTLAGVFINRHFGKIFAAMKAEMEAKDLAKQAEIEAKRKRTEELRAQGISQENKGTSKKKKQLHEREKERQRQAANRAAERGSDAEGEENPSRVGHRKYARGRAYDPDRYNRMEDEMEADRDLDLDELNESPEAPGFLENENDLDVYEDGDAVYEDDDSWEEGDDGDM